MALTNNTGAKEALENLNKLEYEARSERLQKEKQAEADEFARKHNLKTPQDFIDFIAKSHSIKKKNREAKKDDRSLCECCGGRMIKKYDRQRSEPGKLVWKNFECETCEKTRPIPFESNAEFARSLK